MEFLTPRFKPVASDTWEIRERLNGLDLETQRIPIEFPGPSTIVGVHVSVIQATNFGPPLLLPTVDTVLALFDVDNQRRYTSSEGQTTPGSRGSQYVTLSALDTEFRDLVIKLDSAKPDVGVYFRWKVFTTGVPIYEDAIISLAFFVVTR